MTDADVNSKDAKDALPRDESGKELEDSNAPPSPPMEAKDKKVEAHQEHLTDAQVAEKLFGNLGFSALPSTDNVAASTKSAWNWLSSGATDLASKASEGATKLQHQASKSAAQLSAQASESAAQLSAHASESFSAAAKTATTTKEDGVGRPTMSESETRRAKEEDEEAWENEISKEILEDEENFELLNEDLDDLEERINEELLEEE